jgi:aryl-alcohol dehydrogenase-like predicted oxidoreductase
MARRGQGRHGRAGGARIVPICGTRRLDRVKENLAAAEVNLFDEGMFTIEARLARIFYRR